MTNSEWQRPGSEPLTQELTFEQARLLAVLIEKAMTTPEQYPLTVNSLTMGCNQKTNRDPVTEFDEGVVMRALSTLRSKGLADQAPPSPGARSNRYVHKALETLHWDRRQQAVMAELILRGPQTPGELRGHAGRMTSLPDVTAVLAVLGELSAAQSPWVVMLPRSPGRREDRYAHLLCGPVNAAALKESEPASRAMPTAERESIGARVERLEHTVEQLAERLARLERGA
ncbi:MAG: YceH family protein [Phycisphaerales bacterium]|nr:YceH family protein [Phycisphaerales bacterium]